ncbi:MAG TPA: hypothetical protein ENN69_03785 [Spirochaetia bacterium]|nr:hypothetical protein [Spirochaetia bacterium]
MNISVNHLGFRPDDQAKHAVIWGSEPLTSFQVIDLTDMGYNEIGPNARPNTVCFRGELCWADYPWGRYAIADFSPLSKPGLYLITLDNRFNSVPFQIRSDVYSRTLRKPFEYIHLQRCGDAAANYHDRCHLDDARRRDTGEYVDTVGGWHDAGDLRKWVEHTLMLGIGLGRLETELEPAWRTFDLREGDIRAEIRWGNQYFLKMQAADGQVWHDVGGGVDGDNSDNHWTDNRIGTEDDRFINTSYSATIQWEFISFQAQVAGLFGQEDAYYARRCREAAEATFRFMADKTNATPKEFAWAVLALCELFDLTGDVTVRDRLEAEIAGLLSLQETDYRFEQQAVRGFFYADARKTDLFRSARDSGLPLIALCRAAEYAAGGSVLKKKLRRAIELYTRGYLMPLSRTNPFAMIPYGVYTATVPGETYRPLGGKLFYRFFVEVKGKCAFGVNSHLLSHAVGLQAAGTFLEDADLRVLARRQVEWVMGGNTEHSCLMSGEGINNPYPHSRFLGLIQGGIVNGIAGTEEDVPFLDLDTTMDWRTAEYWSPHVSFYLWYGSRECRGLRLDPLPY